MYSNANEAIHLNRFPRWRDTLKTIDHRANEEKQHQPITITAKEVDKALSILPPNLAAALIITWYTASRVGDALQLWKSDLILSPQGNLKITFFRGKGVKLNGPYTLETKATGCWFAKLKDFLAKAPSGPLWPDPSGPKQIQIMKWGFQIRDAIRCINPLAEQKSIRRSALQALALQPGATIELLMKFAGHKRKETTYRYLGWGKVIESEHIPMRELALKALQLSSRSQRRTGSGSQEDIAQSEVVKRETKAPKKESSRHH
jgi:hypothetical protein